MCDEPFIPADPKGNRVCKGCASEEIEDWLEDYGDEVRMIMSSRFETCDPEQHWKGMIR